MKLDTIFDETGFQTIWNRFWGIMADKSGGLNFEEIIPNANRSEMKIGNTVFIINSRYNGKEDINAKLKRLIVRTVETKSKAD